MLASAFRGDLTADWRAQHPDVESASKLLERIRAERRRRWEEAEMEKMRAKGKRPKDDSWKSSYEQPQPPALLQSPELPDGWTWASWKEVGFSQNGRAFPSSAYCASGVKLLRPGNLHASGTVRWTQENTRCMPTSFAEQHPDFVVGGNQLVINLTAQSLKDEFLGRVCLTEVEEQCLLNQRIARLAPVNLSPSFCLWLFKSPVFRKYVDGLNTGSLIQHMFTSQVDEFVFPLPPHEEQQEIVRRVEMAIPKINALSAIADHATDQLHQVEKAALAKAFRGELVPQDPNDEPASVLLERLRAEREASDGSTPKRSRGRRPAA